MELESVLVGSVAKSLGVSITAIVDVLNALKEKGNWVRKTVRITELTCHISCDPSEVLSFDHHVRTLLQLFKQHYSHHKHLSVVLGHSQQGKSQFLYFVACFLKELGQTVVYLDHTVLPVINGLARVHHREFCGNFWKNDLLKINCLKESLTTFLQTPSSAMFVGFFSELDLYVSQGHSKVWVLIDDVVQFENFGVMLPEEQLATQFNYIVTGGAGMDTFVRWRQIDAFVFDLPLLSKDEGFKLAERTATALGVDLLQAVPGFRYEGLLGWVEERFGGVSGYIVEFLLLFKKGGTYPEYVQQLSRHVQDVIVEAGITQNMTRATLCDDWLNEIRTKMTKWKFLLDSGLCGRIGPRGVVLASLISWLFIYTSSGLETKKKFFNSMFSHSTSDRGVSMCLYEMNVKASLLRRSPLSVAQVFLQDEEWVVHRNTLQVLDKTKRCLVTTYTDSNGRGYFSTTNWDYVWVVIQVPAGFDVADILLFYQPNSIVYYFQITLSEDPFSRRHTLETCSQTSKDRMELFRRTLESHLGEVSITMKLVLMAPNCSISNFAPPVGNSNEFCLHPDSVLESLRRKTAEEAQRNPRRKHR